MNATMLITILRTLAMRGIVGSCLSWWRSGRTNVMKRQLRMRVPFCIPGQDDYRTVR